MTDLVTQHPTQTRASSDDELVNVWLRSKRSEQTKRAYRRDTDQFREWTGKRLRALTLEDVQAYVDDLSSGDYAASTVRRKVMAMRSLLKFAHRVGYLMFDVGGAVPIPHDLGDVREKILSELEVAQLIEAAELASIRDGLLVRTLYVTGLRVAELVALRWSDCFVHDAGATVGVVGKGEKKRNVDVPAALWVRLCRWRGTLELPSMERDAYIWLSREGAGHITTSRAYQIVRAAAEAAGIDKPISPHWLRHSCATHALNNGCPIHVVQKRLGHADLKTTAIYANLLPGQRLSDFLKV